MYMEIQSKTLICLGYNLVFPTLFQYSTIALTFVNKLYFY